MLFFSIKIVYQCQYLMKFLARKIVLFYKKYIKILELYFLEYYIIKRSRVAIK